MDTFAVLQAFAAGMLSFFAPCSVAMLPAYISYYLRGEGTAKPAQPAPPVQPDAPGPRRWLALALLPLGLLSLAGAVLYYGQVNRGFARLSALPVALALLGLVLVAGSAWEAQRRGAGRALLLGGLTSLGILAVFALLGLPFAVLLGVLSFAQLAVLVVAMGALLAALGVLGLLGKDLSFAIPVRAPQRRTPAGFLLFGVAYGLVSMGCTLPLFLLGAVGPLLRANDVLTALLGAVGYGAGMASVMLTVTLAMAVSQGLTQRSLRRAVPWVKRASNVVLIAAGLYIVWYAWNVLRLTV